MQLQSLTDIRGSEARSTWSFFSLTLSALSCAEMQYSQVSPSQTVRVARSCSAITSMKPTASSTTNQGLSRNAGAVGSNDAQAAAPHTVLFGVL